MRILSKFFVINLLIIMEIYLVVFFRLENGYLFLGSILEFWSEGIMWGKILFFI